MPKIPDEFLDTLRERIGIEELVSDYVPLKRAGRLSRGLCPFHSEKTPSFTVYPDTQSFYCFGCGKGGDIITFTRDIENLDYVEAVRLLADRAGLNMPEYNYDDTLAKKRHRMLDMNKEAARYFYNAMMSPAGKAGLDYWTNVRRLSPKTIRHFGLGFAPDDWHGLCNHMRKLGYSNEELFEANLARKSTKEGKTNYYDNFRNRVMVPIIDLRGNIIAFGGRVLDDSKPKYVNTADTLIYKKSNAVFALNFAKSSGKDSLILCEGYMDVIALHQAGFTNAVAGLGTALTDEQVRLIARYCTDVYLSYDMDEAGRKAMATAIQKFGQTELNLHTLNLQGGKDPDEIIKNFGPERFQSILDGATNEVEYQLLEARRKYDTGTDDGRVRYLRDAAQILAGLRSPVERDVYASRLSGELGVSKEAISLQIEQMQRRSRARNNKVDFGTLRHEFDDYGAQAPGTPDLKVQKAEETILASLMNNADFYPLVSSKLHPEDFVTDFHRNVFTVLSSRLRDSQSIDPIYLSADFQPDEMSRIVKMRAGTALLANTKEEVMDCIKVLKDAGGSAPKNPSDLSDDELRDLFRRKQQETDK
ncbi:MAG: DNA primase [Clostridia bacterium]|nr:DNA primase [Clostridia bacterium]